MSHCCTPNNAWSWARELAVMALAGDDDAKKALPDAVEHYLRAILPAYIRPVSDQVTDEHRR